MRTLTFLLVLTAFSANAQDLPVIWEELIASDWAGDESGIDQRRLELPDLYTSITWYSRYPNHYAGDGTVASAELGELITNNHIETIVNNLKVIKNDEKTLELQNEFFDRVREVPGN